MTYLTRHESAIFVADAIEKETGKKADPIFVKAVIVEKTFDCCDGNVTEDDLIDTLIHEAEKETF